MTHVTIGEYMLTFLKGKILLILHAMFYRNRLDSSGEMYRPAGLNLLASRFNQYLLEKGYSPAWIWSEDDCRKFWSTEVNQYDNSNEPQQYSSKSTALIFTMAVLMHVHPKSYRIFSDMVRVAKRFVVTVEPEFANYGYVFARNYRRVFHRLGCAQLASVTLGIDATDDAIADYHGMILRLFSVPTNKSDSIYNSEN